MTRLQATITATALTVLGVAGIAFAVDQGDPSPLPEPPKATATLAEGQTPGGERYTISAVDTPAPKTMFCFEIATERQRGHGCVRVPANDTVDGKSLMPRRTLLGTTRFASLLAPEGVEGMRVVDPDGQSIATARAVAVEGFGQLLLAAWGGPQVTSTRPDPDHTLELLDESGKIVAEVPFPGFGKDR